MLRKRVFAAPAVLVFGFGMPAGAQETQHCNASTGVCTMPPPTTGIGEYDDDRIAEVIKEATENGYKSVEFPVGLYTVTKPISLMSESVTLSIKGAGIGKTIIEPAIFDTDSRPFGFSIFNIQRATSFKKMELEISGFTIDMDILTTFDEYRDLEVGTAHAHGVRIGQGWRGDDPDGWVLIKDLRIEGAPGYGIGIQTRSSDHSRAPADNITVENVEIYRTGSDGIDTKEAGFEGKRVDPRNLVLRNLYIEDVGLNEKDKSSGATAAHALDLRYNDVTIENVTIFTAGRRRAAHGERNTNVNGINFRDGPPVGSPARASTIRNVYVSGSLNAVAFSPMSQYVSVSNFVFERYENSGISFRGGLYHRVEDGCILAGSPESPRTSYVGVGDGVDQETWQLDYTAVDVYDPDVCPAYTQIGFIPDVDRDGIRADLDCNDLNEQVGAPSQVRYLDSDDDGYGDPNSGREVCANNEDYVDNDDDCDDSDRNISPSGPIFCEAKSDNECSAGDQGSRCGQPETSGSSGGSDGQTTASNVDQVDQQALSCASARGSNGGWLTLFIMVLCMRFHRRRLLRRIRPTIM